jgi:hypothetical protein
MVDVPKQLLSLNHPPDIVKQSSGSRETSDVPEALSKSAAEKDKKRKAKARVVIDHLDIIKEDFWVQRPWILSGKAGTPRS